jgi:phosphatidylglycerophosphatase A
MKAIAKVIATVFYIGYFPLAPGTLTCLLIVFGYKFFLHKLEWPYYLILLAFLFVVGGFASTAQAARLKTDDPRCIVIDEALGQLLVYFHLRPDWMLLIAGFILFRLLDILKPFIIKEAERIPRGWGIMMDDVVAALFAAIALNLYLVLR